MIKIKYKNGFEIKFYPSLTEQIYIIYSNEKRSLKK